MASELEVLKTLHMLGFAYPNARIAEETLTVYISLLEDLPADKLGAAACEHIARSTFFPSVAELRERTFRLEGYLVLPEVIRPQAALVSSLYPKGPTVAGSPPGFSRQC